MNPGLDDELVSVVDWMVATSSSEVPLAAAAAKHPKPAVSVPRQAEGPQAWAGGHPAWASLGEPAGGTVVVIAAGGADAGAATAVADAAAAAVADAAIAVAEAAATAVAVAAGLGGRAAGWRGIRFDVGVGLGNAGLGGRAAGRRGIRFGTRVGLGRAASSQAQEMFWITLRNHAVLRIVGMCVSKCESLQLFHTNP